MDLFRVSTLLPRPATGSGCQCLSHLLQMKGRVSRRPNRQTALVPSTSLSKVAASKAMETVETVEKEEDEKFQTVVLSLIARYSRYSWLTWIVVKIILKVTTYTVLKVIISLST